MINKKYINYSNYLLGFLFLFFIAYFKFQYHELWKDEWQAWFVAKDKSLGEIFSFLYYEGHPALWYIYLKIFSIFSNDSNDLLLINIAHLLTVAGGLYLLFVKFRLPILIKVLLASSYFLFFEYGILNRGYFLVIIFAFWAAWLMSQKEYSKIQLAVVLFLLCQTEVYGTIMAVALGFYIAYNNYNEGQKVFSKPLAGLGLGLLAFIISVFPRDFSHIVRTSSQSWSWSEKLLISIQGNLTNTYLPGLTKDTFTYGSTVLGLLFAIACLVGLFFIFKKDKALLLTLGIFLIGVISFSFLIFTGGIRQWGMGFVFFIAMLQLRDLELSKEKMISVIIGIFCVFNIIHGYKAMKEDYLHPFTNAKDAGEFLKAKVPVKVPIVALNKFDSTPVIGYAQRKFYELPNGVPFSYFRWVDKVYVPTENELKLFGKYKDVGGIILLSPKPIDNQRYPSAQLWEKFDSPNYKNEFYFIYTMAVR